MLWADSEGNIGYQLIGRIPLRKGGCPDLPKPGWTGEFEWDGTIPYEELPEVVNPAQRLSGDRQQPHRGRRLPPPHHLRVDDRLPRTADRGDAGRAGAALASGLRADAARLLLLPGRRDGPPALAPAPRRQRETRAIERLKSWDGSSTPDTIAGTIYHAFTVVFAEAIVRAAVDDRTARGALSEQVGLGLFAVVSSPWRFQARLLELWDEGDPAWFASAEQPEGRAWDEVALEALEAALDGLEDRFGRDPDRWRWGRVHGVEFSHPFGQANPLFRRIFNRSVEAGGASETVTQNGYLATAPFTGVWGPVYRMLADLGDPARSRWQLTTGQSGHPGSRHYDDLLEGWRDGRTNPVYPTSTRSAPRAAPSSCGSIRTTDAEQPRPDQDEPAEVAAFLGSSGCERVPPTARRLAARDRAVVRDAGTDPWIWTYRKSQKVKNLERDDRATLLVESGIEYAELRGVMLKTRARIEYDTERCSTSARSCSPSTRAPARSTRRCARPCARRRPSAWRSASRSWRS